MIQRPAYKHRTLDQLYKAAKQVQNRLEMRDWQIVIETGKVAPSDFKCIVDADGAAFCHFEPHLHSAYIWMDLSKAKESNTDPLWLLYHEIGHIFHDIHDEETRCNIIANLIY